MCIGVWRVLVVDARRLKWRSQLLQVACIVPNDVREGFAPGSIGTTQGDASEYTLLQ